MRSRHRWAARNTATCCRASRYRPRSNRQGAFVMLNSARRILIGMLALAAAGLTGRGTTLDAQGVLVPDPTKVVMIVNRDSNDIGFMDIATHKIIKNVFLGNNVNPHMVMMSPDGRYVVTGGTRANKAFIIDTKTLQLVKVIPVDIAPEHLAFSPDSRWYYQGNPEGDSISVIDMQSLTKIKTIPGFAEPLNVTFSSDGAKAYVGNYGAHWIGVVDVRRHELLKKIQIDKVVKVIRVGPDPWRIYMSHDGKYAITPNNGDNTISIIDLAAGKVAATLEAGENMTGVNFAAGKAFVISSTSGFVYVYDMKTLRPAGRMKIGTNIQLETATTDTKDEK